MKPLHLVMSVVGLQNTLIDRILHAAMNQDLVHPQGTMIGVQPQQLIDHLEAHDLIEVEAGLREEADRLVLKCRQFEFQRVEIKVGLHLIGLAIKDVFESSILLKLFRTQWRLAPKAVISYL